PARHARRGGQGHLLPVHGGLVLRERRGAAHQRRPARLERSAMPEDRRYPARPFLAASVATFRDGRVLIATRARPPMEACWSLPGGLVEPGESLREAALRELREEVGVEAEIAA